MRNYMSLGPVLWLLLAAGVGAAENGRVLEDFESADGFGRWSFSNGAEFPGAKGRFSRAADAAHAGAFGGKLEFDFRGGGRYVAAVCKMPEPAAANQWNAVQLWVKRPEGHELGFRYTDSAGQTFQRPVECAADRWAQVTIPFSGWTIHWGGPDDGKLRGGPRMLSFNVDEGDEPTGALLFDDVRLVNQPSSLTRVTYPAYRFGPDEGWHLRAEGNAGASRLQGQSFTADFSQGASSLTLGLPDHVLLGDLDRLRLRVRGRAPGHPVRLVLHTHFMTFYKTIGEFTGDGDQELVTEAPPGPGWEWHGGENDGKIHGPLRLGEIQFLRGDHKDTTTLELREVAVEATCPNENRCVLLADTRGEGTAAQFTARVRAVSDAPLAGKLHWTVRDWEGLTLESGETGVTVPARTEAVEIQTPVPARLAATRRFLEAEFSLDIPGQQVPPAAAVWLAGVEQPGDATLTPDSPFGMGVYLNRYGGDPRGLALMERAANLARDAGVKWSREDFSWGRLEPRPGQFDWTYYDHLLACARRNGISVYAIVGYWAAWTKPYTAAGIDDYVRFVKALVGRYHNDIHQWEIWNEPNIFFWQGPKDMYAELLTRSYAAIKEVDPAAQVLGLSTSGIDNKFIARMLDLKAPFDVLTIHPYRRQLNDQTFIQDLAAVAEQVKRPDGARRPVWLTEMGWATHQPHNTSHQDFVPTSLREQAQLIARSYLCAIVSGVEPRTFWYDFRNDGEDPMYFEHQMGIVYSDFRPKPAYIAFATLTQALKGRKLAGSVPAPAGVFAFRFQPVTGQNGEVIAAWSPRADAEVELPWTAGRATRVNGLGERAEAPVANGKVRLALRKGAPAYLLVEP